LFLFFWEGRGKANGCGIERKGVGRLVAKAHPDNGASQRVCGKCGGVKGETLRGMYERFVDGGRKSDQVLWYFYRPEGPGAGDDEKGDVSEKVKGVVEGGKEDS
jgi:hypothetical protein